jgi:predicted regulator of amino acid metabolism with ACT domain
MSGRRYAGEHDRQLARLATLQRRVVAAQTKTADLIAARGEMIDQLRNLDPPVPFARIASALGVTTHAIISTHKTWQRTARG